MGNVEMSKEAVKLGERQQELVRLNAEAAQILGRPYDRDEQIELARQDYRSVIVLAGEMAQRKLTLGKRLLIMSDLEGKSFPKIVSEIGMDIDQAEKAIALYREYGDALPKALVDTSANRLLLIARLDVDTKEYIKEHGELPDYLGGDKIDQTPNARLRELVRQQKDEIAQLKDDKAAGEERVAKLSGRVAELETGQRTRTDAELIKDVASYSSDVERAEISLSSIAWDLVQIDGLMAVSQYLALARKRLAALETHILRMQPSFELLVQAEHDARELEF